MISCSKVQAYIYHEEMNKQKQERTPSTSHLHTLREWKPHDMLGDKKMYLVNILYMENKGRETFW